MILQELYSASSNQLTALLYSGTPSGVGEAVSSSLALFLCSFIKSLPQDCSDSSTDNLMD